MRLLHLGSLLPRHILVWRCIADTQLSETGEFVEEEIDCLRNMLPQSRSLETCSVCLMSDRNLTIQLLSAWLLANNCTPVLTDVEQVLSEALSYLENRSMFDKRNGMLIILKCGHCGSFDTVEKYVLEKLITKNLIIEWTLITKTSFLPYFQLFVLIFSPLI